MIMGDTPFLASHVDGDTAWLDFLFVPRALRHQGYGTRIFNEWLKRLPEVVRRVEVLAVDLDGEHSAGFWRRMGFEPETEFEFGELLNGSYMERWLRPPTRDPAVKPITVPTETAAEAERIPAAAPLG